MGHKYQPTPHKGEIHKKAWGHELWIANHEAYCGKLLVFEKDKKFSMHYHLIKEESWYVAEGEFEYSWIDTEKASSTINCDSSRRCRRFRASVNPTN
jgi:quercetin dioxygenase-like cupin family protein